MNRFLKKVCDAAAPIERAGWKAILDEPGESEDFYLYERFSSVVPQLNYTQVVPDDSGKYHILLSETVSLPSSVERSLESLRVSADAAMDVVDRLASKLVEQNSALAEWASSVGVRDSGVVSEHAPTVEVRDAAEEIGNGWSKIYDEDAEDEEDALPYYAKQVHNVTQDYFYVEPVPGTLETRLLYKIDVPAGFRGLVPPDIDDSLRRRRGTPEQLMRIVDSLRSLVEDIDEVTESWDHEYDITSYRSHN